MIDNTYVLNPILHFQPNSFYKFVVLVRPKDKMSPLKKAEKKEILVRDWWISNQEQLDKFLPEMIEYCNLLGARLYLLTDRKNTFKVLNSMQKKMLEMSEHVFFNKNNNINTSTTALKKIPASCSSLKTNTDKGNKSKWWVYDIDSRDLDVFTKVTDRLGGLLSTASIVSTKNGYHLLVPREYNAYEDEKYFKENNIPCEVKENSLTLIYMPGVNKNLNNKERNDGK